MRLDADTVIGGWRRRFPSTRRSLISAATGDGHVAHEAVGAIIAAYWKPAYKYIRLKWNRDNEDAKDLVQGFFAALLDGNLLSNFDPSQASFRTYLKVCLDRFVMKQDESAARLKRGGDARMLALDFDAAEQELAFANRAVPADELFQREWQRQIFALAIEDLRQHAAATGKLLLLQIFEEYDLADDPRPKYQDLAAAHGVSVSSVTNALAWARRELRRMVLARVGSVTTGNQETRAESRRIFA
jgi:RNA polymerase sigma factor (sigma-70 family)